MSLERKKSDPMPFHVFEEMFEPMLPGKDRINFLLGLLESSEDNIRNLDDIKNKLSIKERALIYFRYANSPAPNPETLARLFSVIIPLEANAISDVYRSLARFQHDPENDLVGPAFSAMGIQIATMYRNTDQFRQLLERVKTGDELTSDEWHVYFYTANREQFESSFTDQSAASLSKLLNDPEVNRSAQHTLLQFSHDFRLGNFDQNTVEAILTIASKTTYENFVSPLNLANTPVSLLFSSATDISRLLLGANLDESQLTNMTIPKLTLSNVSMRKANLSGSAISRLSISQANMNDTLLENLTFGEFSHLQFQNCYGVNTSLVGASNASLTFIASDFTNANLSNSQIRKLEPIISNLSNAKFINCSIAIIDTLTANLSHADFSKSIIETARFVDNNLQSANFQNVRFNGMVTFKECNLIDVNFSNITFGKHGSLVFDDVKVLKLDHIKWDDPTSDPKQELQKSLTQFSLYCQKHRYTGDILHLLRDAAAKQVIAYIKNLPVNDHERLDLLKYTMSHQTFAHRNIGSKVAHGLVSTFSSGKMLSSSQQLFQNEIVELEAKGVKPSTSTKTPK